MANEPHGWADLSGLAQGFFRFDSQALVPILSFNEGDGTFGLRTLEVAGLAIVSQTCDVVGQRQGLTQLAPLVQLDDDTAAAARKGHQPSVVPLPGAGPNWFVAIDQVFTVDKKVVAQAEWVEGLATTVEQQEFGRSVGRKFGRFAFPDDLSESLRPMVQRLKSKSSKDSAEGELVRGFAEIRAQADPNWVAQGFFCMLQFVVEPGVLPGLTDEDPVHFDLEDVGEGFTALAEAIRNPENSPRRAELLQAYLDRLVDLCEPEGAVEGIAAEVIGADELSLHDLRETQRLDLEYLTPIEDEGE